MLEAHGGKYLEVFLKENGSSGEIKISNDFWFINVFLVIYFAGLGLMIYKIYSKVKRLASDDSYRISQEIIQKLKMTGMPMKSPKKGSAPAKGKATTPSKANLSTRGSSVSSGDEGYSNMERPSFKKKLKNLADTWLTVPNLHNADIATDLLYFAFIPKISLFIWLLMLAAMAKPFKRTFELVGQ